MGDPQIGEVFRQAHVSLSHEILPLMRKDSLELTDADRSGIRDAVVAAEHSAILVTHGTDTMTDTAKFLSGIPGKTIVLTGALIPARFRENDAIFNIGFALAAVQVLPTGVYIAMNGRIYDPAIVRKDREANSFVEIEEAGRD